MINKFPRIAPSGKIGREKPFVKPFIKPVPESIQKNEWRIFAAGLLLCGLVSAALVNPLDWTGRLYRSGWLYPFLAIVLSGIVYLVFSAVIHAYALFKSTQSELSLQLGELERIAADANQRLASVFRLSQRFVEATDENDVIELVLRLSVDSVGAVGASFVPLDERGQAMASINYGEIDTPVVDAWLEYLASPPVRQRCGVCQNYGRVATSCPMLKGPVFEEPETPEVEGMYCLPLRRGEHEFGVLNLFMPKEHSLDQQAQVFLWAMVDETSLALEGVRLRRREIEALRQLQDLRQRSDIKEVLSAFLENVRDTLQADFTMLILQQASGENGTVSLASGNIPVEFRPILSGLMQGVLTSEKPILLGDVSGDPVSNQQIRALMITPLNPPDEETIGAISVGSFRKQGFSQRQLSLLRTISGQLALVVENIQSMSEIEYKTIMAERTRLAREIHDGLAQTLGFLKLQTAQMQNLLEKSDIERLQESLRTSYKILSEAYQDARHAIDGLRISPSEEGLAGWLEQTALEFQESTGLSVRLVNVDKSNTLAPEVQAQLIRIVQEALSNVRKHAEASEVWITFDTDGKDMVLEVQDNGRGFSPEDIPGSSRYGLKGMRERTDLIGAEFQVVSLPGSGTTVRVRLPVIINEMKPE
jgi:two-component system nitrate/nitrite sensor histidine kinase NarX